MNRISKKMLAYLIFLIMFTSYVVLDSFVITRVYSETDENKSSADITNSIDTGKEAENESTNAEDSSGEIISDEKSYSDGNISVNISEYREYETNIYIADVQISSSEYLKTALANGVYGKNVKQTTSEMAEENGAILAINGDYYGARESGYVIKNGTLYRTDAAQGREDLVIYEDGTFEIISEDEVSAEELIEKGAVNTLSFGPTLVENGSIVVGKNEEVGQAMASNPRTAIGVVDKNHYVFVVSDGRTDESEGLSLHELAEIMQEMGCKTAYNLDGGGSSTMYFNGEVINNPTGGRAGYGSGSERSVSDIVYIGYGEGERDV